MINKIFAILTITFLTISCNKDKFNTKPSLTFKSINANSFVQGDYVKIELTATDKEGDLTDTLFMYRINRNCNNTKDTFKYAMPAFPVTKNLEVPITLTMQYGASAGILMPYTCINRNDSCRIRFKIKDKANNISDEIESPEFVLKK